MRTSFSRIAWALVGVGLIAGLLHVVTDRSAIGDALYLAATIQLAVGVILGLVMHRPSVLTWSFVLAIALFSTTAQVLDGTGGGTTVRILSESGFLAVQLTLAAALLVVTVRRSGASLTRSLGDGLIVALGTWILIWLFLIQPSIDAIVEPNIVTGLRGLTLATSTVVLFLHATRQF
jgi:hypothetical protein